MTSELFRRQVLEARKEDWLGSVHLSSMRLGWPMAILAGGVSMFVALILVLGAYTRKEHAQGQLVPVGGLLNVAATVSGVVTRRLVSEGDTVTSGQPLIEITPSIDLPQTGGAVGERIATELENHQQRLRLEIKQLAVAGDRQAAAIQRRIGSLQQQLASAAAELELRTQQVTAAERMLARIRPLLDAHTLSAVQGHQQEEQVWNARAQLELATRNHLEAAQALNEARAQLGELPLQSITRINEIEGALADMAQSSARNLAQRATLLRAPSSGVVSGLAVNSGQTVFERQRLLSIIPERVRFEAELWAPSDAVGLIATGDRVAMRYHAFPYQEFGQQYGRIVEIAGSSLSAEEVRSRTGINLAVPTFRVVVELERQHVQTAARNLPLRAGMSLDADFLLERRRLYELLIAPIDKIHSRPSPSAATIRPREAA